MCGVSRGRRATVLVCVLEFVYLHSYKTIRYKQNVR